MANNLQELLKRYEELGAEIERLKEINKEKLHLVVDNGELRIIYKNKLIGLIAPSGQCYILTDQYMIDAYKQWREAGMSVDCNHIVEWKNGRYVLKNDNGSIDLIRITFSNCLRIYNFDECIACSDCDDGNIIKFKHNKRPIIF